MDAESFNAREIAFHGRQKSKCDLQGRRMTDRLLDAVEVAERLSVPTTWVRQEAREGRMPCLRLGPSVRFEWPRWSSG